MYPLSISYPDILWDKSPTGFEIRCDCHNKHGICRFHVSNPALKIRQTNMLLRLCLDPLLNKEKKRKID